ncbi:MAG TPA: hypothetical protein VFX18_00470 [Candidatus Nitrosocosmicus sp.]|nr:hypothetical protein [Candidatus Nitrosocosmicus sp.]
MANILSPSTIKKYATVQNILLVGGALGLLYYVTTGGKLKLLPSGNDNVDVDYTVSPMQLVPSQPGSITVKGAFTDQVSEGFYYVSDSNLIPITHGSLGKNITTFSKNIMLPPLPQGKYNISITDKEIDPIRGGKALPTSGGDQ